MFVEQSNNMPNCVSKIYIYNPVKHQHFCSKKSYNTATITEIKYISLAAVIKILQYIICKKSYKQYWNVFPQRSMVLITRYIIQCSHI